MFENSSTLFSQSLLIERSREVKVLSLRSCSTKKFTLQLALVLRHVVGVPALHVVEGLSLIVNS